MEFLLNNKSINLNDFLQHMNTKNDSEQPLIEELSDKNTNSNIDDDESIPSEDETIESSNLSVEEEEEIPDDFISEEHLSLYKGYYPESLIRNKIYKEIQKEDTEDRNKLLLYYSFYELGKVPNSSFFKETEEHFKEIERKIHWKFYKLLSQSKDFDEFIIERIIETNNPRLLIFHFMYEKNKENEEWKEILKESDLFINNNDKNEYCKLISSLLEEIYS